MVSICGKTSHDDGFIVEDTLLTVVPSKELEGAFNGKFHALKAHILQPQKRRYYSDKIKCICELMKEITPFSITVLVQSIILGIIFFGFLLDPLLGIWIVIIYFFVIGTFLTYYYFSNVSICQQYKTLSRKAK